MNHRPPAALLVALAGLLAWAAPGPARAADPDDAVGSIGTKAPDFDRAEGWLNTDKPLTIDALKGQVVVLDFWTYCCINCMHVFPDLKAIEDKYRGEPVVVVGVHSGKFDQEKDADHIRQAVLRHDIAHPVAVDSEYKVWNAYGVRAWPSLVVVAPDGTIYRRYSGEGHREDLDHDVAALLSAAKSAGTLGKPLTFKRERETFKSGVLEFPGKVLADARAGRLFVADTNHHRVLVAGLDGAVSDVIGSGRPGLADGSFADAQFHQPQGMALSDDGSTLFVADTENHALRAVDLRAKAVTTVAGTGKQTRDRRPDGPGRETALSSPWDVVRVGRTLYVAMAGTHQVWSYDLDTKRVGLLAGAGPERCVDGPNARACFAQPSGLATDGKTVYVADSESSSVRSINLGPDGATSTIAGGGKVSLFTFGHVDRVGEAARFQHPLGVCLTGDGKLLVADTFNNVLRSVDPKTRQVVTWLGSTPGHPDPFDDQGVRFYEPGGLSLAGGTLYIADTNHHRIVAVDVKTRKARVVDVRLPR